MVAINKRAVRLLCSPGPPRGSRSLPRIFPRTTQPVSFSLFSLPLSLRPLPPPPPPPPKFPAVVISEPCEERASRRRKYFTSARKKEKSRTLFFLSSFHLVVQLLRVIVRVNGIAECMGGRGVEYGPSEKRRGREREKDREPRLTVCTFYEINSYVRHISGWLIVTALATEINSRD